MPRRIRASTRPTFSLGWELEATHEARATPTGVIRERDGSVGGQGLEYKISADYVSRIPESLEALRQLTADETLHVDRSCGFHVHLGLASRATPLQRQQWAGNFVMLARAIEDAAFQAVPESRRTNSYCRRWQTNNQAVSTQRYTAHKAGNARYQWVNVVEMFRPGGIGTVEIRLLGCTKRYAYLLGWIGACHAMANSAWAMIQDPTLLQMESDKLRRIFTNVERSLLALSTNQVAYNTAVNLAYVTGLINVTVGTETDRLVTLADRSENVRSERVRSVRAAHTQALDIEINAAHIEAILEDAERRSYREQFPNVLTMPRRHRTMQARRIVPVIPLFGFDPNAFSIGGI